MENLPAEEPGHQRRLHDQRAGRGRRLRGAEGGRQGEGRHDRLGRRRLPRRRRRSRTGIIGATSQQYPLKMAEMGVEAIAEFAKDGKKPQTPGLDFFDTGVTLITDKPGTASTSKDTTFGLQNCWG